MGKRVLLIGGNFSPELTGIGKYNGEMIDMLATLGYHCTVVTSYPYYPQWKIQTPFTESSGWFSKQVKIVAGDNSNRIEIYRCPHYVPQRPTGLKRVLSDFSLFFSAFIKIIQLLFKKKFDFVLVVAPPFQLGLLGILYKKIKDAKFLYHIQDLQIDAARDFKMIRSEFLINLLLRVERYILSKADTVSSISQGMIKKIKIKRQREVVFFPNWVDTRIFFPITEKDQLKRGFGFEATDIIILYSGAIGEKQGLEIILNAAKTMTNRFGLKFVICGSGPYKEKLRELKESQDLGNVIFLQLQPFEKLNLFLNMADIHLVLQKANATDLVMPSKLTAILSVGGVSIISANQGSSLYEVVDLYKMGILIEPENEAGLVAAIDEALKNNGDTISKNARLYAEQFLSIDKILSNFAVYLQ